MLDSLARFNPLICGNIDLSLLHSQRHRWIGPIRNRFFVYELVQIILRIRRVKIMVYCSCWPSSYSCISPMSSRTVEPWGSLPVLSTLHKKKRPSAHFICYGAGDGNTPATSATLLWWLSLCRTRVLLGYLLDVFTDGRTLGVRSPS